MNNKGSCGVELEVSSCKLHGVRCGDNQSDDMFLGSVKHIISDAVIYNWLFFASIYLDLCLLFV